MKEIDRESRRHLVSLKSDDKICPQCGGRKKIEDDVCDVCRKCMEDSLDLETAYQWRMINNTYQRKEN